MDNFKTLCFDRRDKRLNTQSFASDGRQAGFTLVELSIVLIIIGLVIGAVFVGRDMIRLASIRAQIKQVDAYDAAVGTFRTKYNLVPGDMRPGDAQALGFFVPPGAATGSANHGDGDWLVESCLDGTPFAFQPPLGCEAVIFWTHLKQANLSDGGSVEPNLAIGAQHWPIFNNFEQSTDFFPRAKIADKGTVFTTYCTAAAAAPDTALRDGHYFVLAFFNQNAIAAGWQTISGSVVPNIDIYNLDAKIDDGRPYTGRVRFRFPRVDAPPGFNFFAFFNNYFCTVGSAFSAGAAATLPAYCATGDDYNLDPNSATAQFLGPNGDGTQNCIPIIKAGTF